MRAQLKCSSCGAEISNLNLSWKYGKWAWLSFVPLVIFVLFMPIIMDYWMHDRSNFRADLSVRDIQKIFSDGKLEILGIVQNTGSANWSNIVIKAEMFDAEGKFVNELTHQIQADVASNSSEHFKLAVKDIPPEQWEATKDVKVKVCSAWHSRF